MARESTPSARRAVAPFAAAVVGLVALGGMDVGAAAATPGAATDEVRLVLVDIAGTRVGRGGLGGSVAATVVNGGLITASGVTVRYRLPDGVDNLASQNSVGCAQVGRVVTCTVGELTPGASRRVAIGVTEPDRTAVFGTRSGAFLAPTSDQFDPAAGEVRLTTWHHEAGPEGSDLQLCWPIGNSSPNMDVAGGVCDGTNDAAPLAADESSVTAAFPPPFSESLVRSYQFDAEFTAPETGDYETCGMLLDDGSYIAIEPVGDPWTPASVRLSLEGYGTETSAPFPLVGGERYRVLVRISNRGPIGIDNGATNGALAGWDGVGIAVAGSGCGMDDVDVFGLGDDAWTTVDGADVVVAPAIDLAIAGAIEAPTATGRIVSVRVANTGLDSDDATVELGLTSGALPLDLPAGCAAATAATPPVTSAGPSCRITATPGSDRVISMFVTGGPPGVTWRVTGRAGVDRTATDDRIG